jgi:hypothetical protein
VTLRCGDCHASDAGGATMKPIAFETHCHGCHSLAFDARHPDRQAPHAQPAEVRRALGETYAYLALHGEALDPAAPEVARRRPGRELTEEERLGALEWAEQSAARAVDALMESECMRCHVAAPAAAADGVATAPRPEGAADAGLPTVAPVFVVPFDGAARWLPLAKFTHASHGTVECERCHAARSAEASEAVLLPGIAACRECHGGPAAQHGKVASPCLLCHEFHHEDFGPMRPDLPTAAVDVVATRSERW